MTATQFDVTLRGQATVYGPVTDPARVLDRHLGDVMDHLIDLEEGDPRLSTADLSARLATGEVELSITVEAASAEEAASIGLGAIRTAIHAAGGYTPNWGAAAPEPDGTWALEVQGSEQTPVR